jgi:hypothetical protein
LWEILRSGPRVRRPPVKSSALPKVWEKLTYGVESTNTSHSDSTFEDRNYFKQKLLIHVIIQWTLGFCKLLFKNVILNYNEVSCTFSTHGKIHI